MDLNKEQIQRLKQVIEKFPEIKAVAWKLNQAGVFWGIAAGTATYIYNGENVLDEVDIWIAPEEKLIVSEILGQEWESRMTPICAWENVALEGLDFFTNTRKVRGEQVLLEYRWTKAVDEHLREVAVGGVDYKIISPEDIVAPKMINPRENDKEDVLALEKIGLDKNYLRLRLAECGVTIVVDK
jgi:predicted nucleotidyltransferase